jgi:hypothetical protein
MKYTASRATIVVPPIPRPLVAVDEVETSDDVVSGPPSA